MSPGPMPQEVDPEMPRSAYEKAAGGEVDPRCIPQRLDHVPPVGDEIVYPDYPDMDHENWRFLFERQMDLLPGRAGEAFTSGVETLGMNPERIPALAAMSRNMFSATGWRIARIPGLVHEQDFFGLLARRLFPSTDYIRGRDELDYTPAPDCFHDMFGHMPMLTEPAFADFYESFGKVALNAGGDDRTRLERLHWFTVEFGLVRQDDGVRIFGAGILSSKNEVAHALSAEVELLPFDPDKVAEHDYDVWHLQPTLFVLDSFAQLEDGFRSWARRRRLM